MHHTEKLTKYQLNLQFKHLMCYRSCLSLQWWILSDVASAGYYRLLRPVTVTVYKNEICALTVAATLLHINGLLYQPNNKTDYNGLGFWEGCLLHHASESDLAFLS